MSLRGDIFKAKIVSRERPYYGGPPEEDTWMVGLPVDRHCSQPLEIEEKREWVRRHSLNRRLHPMPPSLVAHLAQRRAMREAGIPLGP